MNINNIFFDKIFIGESCQVSYVIVVDLKAKTISRQYVLFVSHYPFILVIHPTDASTLLIVSRKLFKEGKDIQISKYHSIRRNHDAVIVTVPHDRQHF
jgi:hypothetical protein